ncbi:Protein of unknown function VcgC/VcgE [Alteromonadaceae bacterium Bs31]|nr:Protein of unknown function VcgC/VcgE [Alteromonadaceae bacterium Bs31]
MKKIVLLTFICVFASQAHAGLWESIGNWFSGDDEKPVEASEQSAASSTDSVVEQGLQLLPFLVQQLGVTEGQASGGLGSLLQVATSLLSEKEGKSLLSAIPDAAALLGAAPAVQPKEGDESALSGVLKVAGEHSETAKMAAQLTSQFDTLGMGADMIPKFTRATESYLGKTDNADAASLLSKALSSFM